MGDIGLAPSYYIRLFALTSVRLYYGVFTPEQDNDKTNVEPVQNNAFHTTHQVRHVGCERHHYNHRIIELHRIEMTALSQRTAPGVHSGRGAVTSLGCTSPLAVYTAYI